MKASLLIIAAASLLTLHAHADAVWEGSGAMYAPGGQFEQNYDVKVVNTDVAPGVVYSEAKIKMADGTSKVITQKITMHGKNSWSDESSLGKGGGTCYGSDLCENYIQGTGGLAYATTIIVDSPTVRRHLTIILNNGSAVKVLREKLLKTK